ncbi:MAG: methyltransferase domain-containing protein [Oscillospiraceae bacterium]|nr:methyltransferase domain-containing protein [Oscillospiraceae bacterium]
MSDFVCPVCGGKLTREGKCLKCPVGHSYDIAKQGYVNLLMSNSSGAKRHGDDRLMVRARSAFLDRAYYSPLLDSLAVLLEKYMPDSFCLLDAGCGEGWYTAGIAERFPDARICGVDISKDAVASAARRVKSADFAVASVSKLPVEDGYFDALLNVFSPLEAEEYARVLKKGAILIRAVPLPEHLWSLKKAVYDKPYLNPVPEECLGGFECAESRDIEYDIRLESGEDIRNLFTMTPYYYKTGREDQEKLKKLEELEVQVRVRLAVYRKP